MAGRNEGAAADIVLETVVPQCELVQLYARGLELRCRCSADERGPGRKEDGRACVVGWCASEGAA
jgi:hypothetical protein